MRKIRVLLIGGLFCLGQAKGNDSLTIAQSFVNLSLTQEYFDTLSDARIGKMTAFITHDLAPIKYRLGLSQQGGLLDVCYSMLFLQKTELFVREGPEAGQANLLRLKGLLDTAFYYFNKINIKEDYSNPYYRFAHLTARSISSLQSDLDCEQRHLAQLFNVAIYPDFKRIFETFKQHDIIYLDSLAWFTQEYDIDYSPFMGKSSSGRYQLSTALSVISRYLQLQQEIRGRITDTSRLYSDYYAFIFELQSDSMNFKPDYSYLSLTRPSCIPPGQMIPKDSFFWTELNMVVCQALIKTMRGKFPLTHFEPSISAFEALSAITALVQEAVKQSLTGRVNVSSTIYSFPIRAAMPSCITAIPHFRSRLKTMKEVDSYLQQLLHTSGYDERYRYYYANPGFAIMTQLERTDKQGQFDRSSLRFNITPTQSDGFSLYALFKMIFFAQKGDFRMLAIVISSQQQATNAQEASFVDIHNLMKNGYPSLPTDLDNVSLPDKTESILIYHFFQSDEGEMPQLDMTQQLVVRDYLKGSSLSQLLNN